MSIEDEFPPEEELHLDSVLADHYTRLRARAVAMEKALEWRPIDEAEPGVRCQLLCPGGRIVCGKKIINNPFFQSGWYVDLPVLGGWGEDNAWCMHWKEDQPTHFRPLPPAP